MARDVQRRLILVALEAAGRLAGNDRRFVAALARAYKEWRDG